VCDDLEALQTRFHRIFNTSGSPVAGDLNDELEVVIFASSDQYQLYGGVLFDISTNNGGIYLEGDPTDASNQARFIAYVAEWKEEFEVWNLMHEAVHYLDGRFNMQGDFQDTMSASTVWWTEGIAEYVSKLDDNADAIAVGQQKTWQLSQLFETTYSSSTERIYDWGYLAARYAMQQQPTVVDELLMYTRQGQYSAYQSYLNSIQYDHDGDFSNWLDCIAEDDGRDCSGNDPVGEVLLSESSMSGSYSVWRYVYVPEGYDQLYVTTAGGSGNADLYVKYQGWPSKIDYDHASVGTDNNEKLSIAAQSGRYLHILINAQQPFDGVTLTVSATPTP
jgi:microbial collagenase